VQHGRHRLLLQAQNGGQPSGNPPSSLRGTSTTHRASLTWKLGDVPCSCQANVDEYVGGKDAEIEGVMKTFQETSA
jgi:hypothetical protein